MDLQVNQVYRVICGQYHTLRIDQVAVFREKTQLGDLIFEGLSNNGVIVRQILKIEQVTND